MRRFISEYNIETLISIFIIRIYRFACCITKKGEGGADVAMIWDTVLYILVFIYRNFTVCAGTVKAVCGKIVLILRSLLYRS